MADCSTEDAKDRHVESRHRSDPNPRKISEQIDWIKSEIGHFLSFEHPPSGPRSDLLITYSVQANLLWRLGKSKYC